MNEFTFTNSGVSFNTKGVADPTINYSHISDPAESEDFFGTDKLRFSTSIFPSSSPADDNYKLQLSSVELNAKMDKLNNLHTRYPAGKPIFTPPHFQPPAVSSTYKIGV